MVERQVRHYVEVSPEHDDSAYHSDSALWTFLLINSKREIAIIKQRLYQHLAPIVSETVLVEGKFGETSLNYEIVSMETRQPELELGKVYGGKKIKDRALFGKRSSDDCSKLCLKLDNGEI
tara:strand:+ start:2113 stop:2475 length:363 start_codon:yes stop_codon:yes gene_type:complete